MIGVSEGRHWPKAWPYGEATAGPIVQSRLRVPRVAAPRGQTPLLIRWSLILFVLAFPFEAVDLGLGGSLSLSRIAGLPFFLACMLAPTLCFRPPSASAWFFLAYLGIEAVAGLYTPPALQGQATGMLITMIQLVAFFWIASNVFRDRWLAARVLRVYAFSTVVLALCVLAAIPGFADSLRTKEGEGAARLTALDYNPNDLATVVSIAAVIVVGAFLNAVKLRTRLLLGAAAIPLLLLVVRTGSRSGALALLAGLAVFMTQSGGSRRRIVAMGLAGVVFLGAIYVVVTDPLMEARFTATVAQGDSAGRDHIYAAALRLISERPLVGWGPGYGLYELGRRLNYAPGARDAHNLVFYLLLEVGIVGAAPFLFGLWLVVRAAWRGRSGPLGVVPLAMVAVALTANVSHTFLARKPMWLALAVGLASAGGASRLQDSSVRRRIAGKRADAGPRCARVRSV